MVPRPGSFAALTLLACAATAQTPWSPAGSLEPSEPFAGAEFGATLALAGNTLLVGAPQDSEIAYFAGAAYVFVWDGSAWSFQQKLLPDQGMIEDAFGSVVALSDDVAAVSVLNPGFTVPARTEVQIFRQTLSTWTVEATLRHSRNYLFGYGLALSGSTLLVGGETEPPRTRREAVHVYEHGPGGWTAMQQLPGTDGSLFGYAIALDGDTAVVGARGDDVAAKNAGAAYVYRRSGSTWSRTAELIPQDLAANDAFGTGVAIHGERIAVGSPGDDDLGAGSGSVYLFADEGGAWSLDEKVTAGDGAAGDAFGQTVALWNERLIVGAPGVDTGPLLSTGAAYAFVRLAGSWVEQQKLVPATPFQSQRTGTAVALSGSRLFLGVPGDPRGSPPWYTGAGRVHVHQGLLAHASTRNAGSNPDSFRADVPVIAAPWSASVDLSSTGHTHAVVVAYSQPAQAVLPHGQVVLVGATKLFQLPLMAGPTATWLGAIPADPGLVGFTLSMQGAHVLGVPRLELTNALDFTLAY